MVVEERQEHKAEQGSWQWRWRSYGAAAAVSRGGEGEAGKEMWCWEPHGRTLALHLAHGSPMWLAQARRRRGTAPRSGETLKMVGLL